jgi:hypothetical protein
MIRVYEHRKTGETIAITDPRLKFDQIEQVQQEVIAMLEPPAPETATTDPSSSVEPGSEEEKRED